MATQFVQQATQQLQPLYQNQASTIASQIPAIQQLYEALGQGLVSKGQSQSQGILENASGRGLLHSTIPVDAQAGLAAQMTGEQGQLAGQQFGDVGQIQQQVAGINVNQANAIAQLVNTLFGQDMNQQSFALQQQQAERQYQLELERLKRGIY